MLELLFSNKIVAIIQIIAGITGIYEGAAYLYQDHVEKMAAENMTENEEEVLDQNE